jgi:NADPH:quinone reductase-like Zn-dependent oxidoreductase
MDAVITTGHGGLEMLDYRQDVPIPSPDAGEVLVSVSACGLNNTDIWVREGAYGTEQDPTAVVGTGRVPHRFPIIQGGDVVGKVVGVGKGVDASRIGERVICNFMTYEEGPEGLRYAGSLGNKRDGGYAQFVTVPSATTHAIESDYSDAELATLPCSYMTAENMLETAGLKSGETVLVTGASGGVGTALIQLAHVRGARVVALTSEAKREAVASLHPKRIVTRDSSDELASLVKEIDVVADVVAGPLFGDLLASLKVHGRYVTAGAIGGAVVPFDVRTLYMKFLTFSGVSLGMPSHFERVLDLLSTGDVKPLLHGTYPLAAIREAQHAFMSKEHFGNLVVIP